MAIVTANNLTSFTREKMQPILVDNIFTSNSLLFRMREQGSIRLDGGTSNQYQVVVNTGVGGSYGGGYDTLVTADQQFAIQAQVEWRYYHEPVTVAETELLQNQGEKIIDLMEGKVQHAAMGLADSIGTGLWSDGTGNSGNDLDGLRNVLSTTTVSANIDPATYTTWVAQIDSTTTQLTLNALDVQILNQTRGGRRPTDGITTRRGFAKLLQLTRAGISSEAPAMAGNRATAMADAGFAVISYSGIPMYHDDKVPGTGAGTDDTYLALLNLDRLQLVVHQNDDFTLSDFAHSTNQRAKIAWYFWTGNLRTLERRVQGAFTTFDPGE